MCGSHIFGYGHVWETLTHPMIKLDFNSECSNYLEKNSLTVSHHSGPSAAFKRISICNFSPENINKAGYNPIFLNVQVKCEHTHLWIRMLWSWWPCVAIMTSASSRTNTLIFFGSMNLSFWHQSRTVPGVPITICSWSFTPLSTAQKERHHISTFQIRIILLYRPLHKIH